MQPALALPKSILLWLRQWSSCQAHLLMRDFLTLVFQASQYGGPSQ